MKNDINIIQELKVRERHTPDFHKLRQHKNIPLFVYDELKVNFSQNKYLEGSKFLGEGMTSSNDFIMKSDTFPIVFSNKLRSAPNKGHVKGDVFAVTPQHILFLDKIKNNRIFFLRERRSIRLLDQKYDTIRGPKQPVVPCFIYMGNPDYWDHASGLVTHAKMSTKFDDSCKYYVYYSPRCIGYSKEYDRKRHEERWADVFGKGGYEEDGEGGMHYSPWGGFAV